jgi:hypothetical protein
MRFDPLKLHRSDNNDGERPGMRVRARACRVGFFAFSEYCA